MNRPGGPQGPPQQQQQVNIDISQAADVLCVSCGRPYFMEGMRMKRLSPIISPTGKEEMIKVQTLLCMACGWEYGQPAPVVPSKEPTEQEIQ